MLSGLLYCEVPVDGESKRDLETVKHSLTNAIPSLSRVQVGSYSKPESAYANPAGGSILRMLRRMETDISSLREEVVTLRPLREEVAALRPLREEVAILLPLREVAVGIRKRFFANFQEMQQMDVLGSRTTIQEGNKIAHSSDVLADICLLKNGLIDYNRTFTTLYGLDWRAAIELIGYPHVIEAMNRRASVLADAKAEWTKEKEFVALITWTRNASSEELARFAADEIGTTSMKQAFLRLMNSGK
ncbi:hypothetical protein HOY82DRAFT_42705 [Tuber indicum]|nr:hypothetical protein HOY82DRAFT_42705 [Tuber indicum]